jgi:hypothetical protein
VLRGYSPRHRMREGKAMTAFFQLWNNDTNNLIDEYETEAAAAIEVRRRYRLGGEQAISELALLRFDNPATPKVIAMHDDLLRYIEERDQNAPAPHAGTRRAV